MSVVDTVATALVTSAQAVAAPRSLFSQGAALGAILATVSVAAADSDTSIYRIFSNLSPYARPLLILVGNTAITAGTVYDISIYETGVSGAVIADAYFASALDLSSAHASMCPGTALDGMAAVLPANVGKMMYEHAGHTTANMRAGYDIAFTADTVGSAAGTATVLMLFA